MLIFQDGGNCVPNLLPVSTLTFPSSLACDSASGYQILSKPDHLQPTYDIIAIFKMAAVSHFGFALGSWSTPRIIAGCIILKFQLGRIYNSECDFYALALSLQTAYSRPLLGGFGAHFHQMTSPIVLPRKGTSLPGNTSPFAYYIHDN